MKHIVKLPLQTLLVDFLLRNPCKSICIIYNRKTKTFTSASESKSNTYQSPCEKNQTRTKIFFVNLKIYDTFVANLENDKKGVPRFLSLFERKEMFN